MGATIKEVAAAAGVSIATVSHVINKTRYVRPELIERVRQAIEDTGYQIKGKNAGISSSGAKRGVIAAVIPTISGSFFARLITRLTELSASMGYSLSFHLTFDDITAERQILEILAADPRTVGILIAPADRNSQYLNRITSRGIPMVCIERTVSDHSLSCVVADNKSILYKGTQTLLNSGHKRIGLLLSDREISTVSEQLTGFLDAMYDAGVSCDDSNIVKMNLYDKKSCKQELISHYENFHPTAYIACGNRLTLILLSTLQQLAVDIPSQISVIGFSDDDWCHLIGTPLTAFSHDHDRIAEEALKLLIRQINGNPDLEEIHVPSLLEIRRSVRMIGKGPYGETTLSPDNLELTPAEIRELQGKNYRVGISFHYGNTQWAAMHEKGLRYILSRCGISIVSVTDANFDPNLQAIQLESLRMQGVDAIVAIPVDDTATADKFRQLSTETKLIFISNVPDGMNRNDYYSLVSNNERENGRGGAILLGEYFKKEASVAVGFIIHGSKFLGTCLRDMAAEQTIREEYPNITIVESEPFYQIERAYQVAKNMMTAHPEIRGLYVSWEGPALGVIRALKEMNRTDVKIVTFDLDYKIAEYLANGEFLLGISAQKAYEQGIAAGQATAKALLGQRGYEYIGISPCVVERTNLLSAWKEVMHENAPEELSRLLKNELARNDSGTSPEKNPSFP